MTTCTQFRNDSGNYAGHCDNCGELSRHHLTTNNMDDIQVSFISPAKPSTERDRLKPFRIYNLTPIDVFTLTEREAWQLTKTLISALQGYNSKSL